jgi:pimeloyl-ACP methyl ester carboxylesterase
MKVAASNKSQRVGFADKPGIAALRIIFPIMAKLAPKTAAGLALKIFLKPPRHKEPAWEAHFSSTAEQENVEFDGKRVVLYSWGHSEKKILLCHAWGGRGTQLAKFIEPLISKGYRVIAFDAPGHGRSSGKMTDMMEYSAAIHAIERHVGGVDALVAHSFGAGNAMFAVSRFNIHVSKIIYPYWLLQPWEMGN